MGSLVLDLFGARMEPGAGRDVLRYAGAAMLALGVVSLVVVRAKINKN